MPKVTPCLSHGHRRGLRRSRRHFGRIDPALVILLCFAGWVASEWCWLCARAAGQSDIGTRIPRRRDRADIQR